MQQLDRIKETPTFQMGSERRKFDLWFLCANSYSYYNTRTRILHYTNSTI